MWKFEGNVEKLEKVLAKVKAKEEKYDARSFKFKGVSISSSDIRAFEIYVNHIKSQRQHKLIVPTGELRHLIDTSGDVLALYEY